MQTCILHLAKDFPKLPFGLLHYLASLHMFSFLNLLFSVDIHLLFNNQNVIHPGITHTITCSWPDFCYRNCTGGPNSSYNHCCIFFFSSNFRSHFPNISIEHFQVSSLLSLLKKMFSLPLCLLSRPSSKVTAIIGFSIVTTKKINQNPLAQIIWINSITFSFFMVYILYKNIFMLLVFNGFLLIWKFIVCLLGKRPKERGKFRALWQMLLCHISIWIKHGIQHLILKQV